MRGHSTSIGSFTFMIISARCHTSSAVARICAPAATYVSSANPLPMPAPCSSSTVCPWLTSASAPAGASATRFSFVLISFGTPMSMALSSRRLSCCSCLQVSGKR